MLSNVIDYMPFARRWLVNFGAGSVKPETRYGTSPEIFGNLRDIRFNEMEYTVPAEYGPQCLREILHKIKRSEEHTSELQSRPHLVCRLLLEKKKKIKKRTNTM